MDTYRTQFWLVTAAQWTGSNEDELAKLAGERFMVDRSEDGEAEAGALTSKHNSWEPLEIGNWVVRDEQGRISICDAEDFTHQYQRFSDDPNLPAG